MKNIFLVRHGETEWNSLKKLNSRTDTSLSKNGEEQVKKLSKSLSHIKFDYVFSSPLLRAQQTAKLICKDIKIITSKNLIEADFGDFEGCSAESLERNNPLSVFNKWRNGEKLSTDYNLEPLNVVSERANNFLINDLQDLSGNILVTSHGYLIRVLLAKCVLGLKEADFKKIWLSNASCSVIRDSDFGFQIRVINATKLSFID